MQDKRNLEQIYRSAVSGLYARLRSNYDFLFQKYGDKGMELIAEMSRDYGLTIAERARETLENNSIESVASYLIRIFNTVIWGKDRTELIKESTNRFVIKVHDCPLHFENPAMCRAHTMMEKTVVETLNPSLKYNIGKSIPEGDGLCEHIIEDTSISR